MSSRRVALDVMGGDEAPHALLRGALRACAPERVGLAGGRAQLEPQRLLLVGERGIIERGLEELGGNPGCEIVHASQVIEMGESPAAALRAKPDSSIGGCVRAVAGQQAGAMVSMGNTGAVVGASTLGLKTLAGVRRPGIAVTLTVTGEHLTLVDMGANIAPKPEHLVQYAVMGSVYMRDCLKTPQPRVGLLNIGEEESKGTQLLKDAYSLLRSSPVRFIGNIEGGDIFRDVADVVVTDGFTGNVILKLMEQFSAFMLGQVLTELRGHGADWAREALDNLRRKADYAEYGGALLLGVDGIVVIGHGRSDETAVANAIGLAGRALDAEINDHIVRGLPRAAEEGVTG